ncbi:Gag-pol Polyprotein [Phytophthora megakarya]|uniref:Gag-pol Polyprotein n=1 Tax=Phytophthora megakarya TaxID=4795 RepID=A0A225VL40_9STRA|nr:Gag-pol Polyprotein [Phytophthora megakarya]
MLIGAVNDILNPTTCSEALESDHAEGWAKAMDEDYNSLLQNETWEPVPRPQRKQGQRQNSILTSVWVIVTKRNEKGEVERLKARLAIRGFMQKFGIDYLQTYCPVVRIESVQLVLLISMFLGLECKHVDFVTAFLNGELNDVDIYMEQPEGYEDGTDRVCRLRKSLYGLKQASKVWNDTLHKILVEIRFVQCTHDAGVY